MISEKVIAIARRRTKVAELTGAGKSEREIARELGVSRTTVWTDKQVNAEVEAAMRDFDARVQGVDRG